MSRQSKILLLYTGGTIGMMKDEKSQSLRPFDFASLLEQIPELSRLDVEIHTESLDQPIDSSNIKPDHWIRLANQISENYDNYDGFVVLHGSDTMAYSASALSFLLENLGKPVIFTGSQLPIGVARSDARENLLTTIEIVRACTADERPMIPEVGVYFEYDLFRGNRTHKISTEDFEAFQSLNYPRLAEAGVNIKFNHSAIMPHPTKDFNCGNSFSDEVGVLTVFPGMTPKFVEAVLHTADMRGLIVRSFGSGNVPMDEWLLTALKECIKRGVYVANISQCNGGGVQLGKYEASKGLKDMGMISGGDMTFEAGITKMMYLLPRCTNYEEFRSLYESDLRGELTT